MALEKVPIIEQDAITVSDLQNPAESGDKQDKEEKQDVHESQEKSQFNP